jgi:hypothetical protein
MSQIEERLAELGVRLPDVAPPVAGRTPDTNGS